MLQLEALAHIEVHKQMLELLAAANINPYQERFWRALHEAFYAHLPEEFRWVETQEGTRLEVLPGQPRTTEVRVGRHVAPAAEALGAFLERLKWAYRLQAEANRLARIVTIEATHHRLAWLHPFLEGNGRVIRLFSNAAFLSEGLAAGSLWSMTGETRG